jgi:hypothetical protein
MDKARWDAVKFYPYEMIKHLSAVVIVDEETETIELLTERSTGLLRRTWPLEMLDRLVSHAGADENMLG